MMQPQVVITSLTLLLTDAVVSYPQKVKQRVSLYCYPAPRWKHMYFNIKGYLLKGIGSLTIENAAKADSGLYYCHIEHKG
ncbi:PREDICTED: hepatitis A virus cellular receptor 1 homolog [Galeopterus variegatus]|uniref:Hepatitis A virus cellular receptor 1 homolog n=1 Tax=Galeopterus variegatus TaxID=482537 RepID=A0ABM0Q2P2_GALVR|nr:PREDICTED: hepatitis A virus cellular receptor 1 homolog [Galeopterus variegatus]